MEELLDRLKGGKLIVRQLVVPDRSAPRPAGPAKVAEMSRLRLYAPTNELSSRVGEDVKPLVNYIKALEKGASTCLEKETLPRAKGLLIAVGLKPGKKARGGCQGAG